MYIIHILRILLNELTLNKWNDKHYCSEKDHIRCNWNKFDLYPVQTNLTNACTHTIPIHSIVYVFGTLTLVMVVEVKSVDWLVGNRKAAVVKQTYQILMCI